MKRFLIFAALTLLAVSSSGHADDKTKPKLNAGPVIRDHRTNVVTAHSGPVIRDHRTNVGANAGAAVKTGPIIRDHRTVTTTKDVLKPKEATGPVIRDHRTTPEMVKSKDPIIRTTVMPGGGPIRPIQPGKVVRDHRNGAGGSGGIKVTASPKPRQTVDNTVRGVGPGPLDVIDAIDNGLSDISRGVGTVGNKVGNAVETVGTKVGNAVSGRRRGQRSRRCRRRFVGFLRNKQAPRVWTVLSLARAQHGFLLFARHAF
jgi:hypothetical protein